MHRILPRLRRTSLARSALGLGLLGVALSGSLSCSSSSSGGGGGGSVSPDVTKAVGQLQKSDWQGALASCQAGEKADPNDCNATYCEFIARTMLVVDQINNFLLPRYRRPLTQMPGDVQNLATTNMLLDAAEKAGESTIMKQCQIDLPLLPIRMGDAADPVLLGEIRGLWTTRDAHMVAALLYSISYGLQAEFNAKPVPAPPAGSTTPALPPLLDTMRQHLASHQQLLFSQPADPSKGIGGWLDRNGNGKPDAPDELLIDIFKPGSQERVFDFSQSEFVAGESLPFTALTPTASLPAAKCGYQKLHINDVATGTNVLATDGMSFSPDGTKIVFPLEVADPDGGATGKAQIQIASIDATGAVVGTPSCLTCGQPGNNDGVRWRPTVGDAIIFISDRDHPYATGNAGGGFGQELYAMKPDGTQPTRLTTSHAWATNYHVNWSLDGQHIVWGGTDAYAWDVLVADFVNDAQGMRLTNQRRVVHDTTWWETHGFTPDNGSIMTTNTRAGFQETDLYAIDIATGARKRLTTSPAWDEHGHLSPDGREVAWISGRNHPASVLNLDDGKLTPVFDFLWVIPGIFFEFLNPPAGYTTELTLMDVDGNNLHKVTDDQLVVADLQWSADGKHIIFRQSNNNGQTTKIRLLTFDDCP
jgi:Tol biopolymer transport system component